MKAALLGLAAALLTTAAHAAPVQWTSASGGNDHWYEVVGVPTTDAYTWDEAFAEAASRTHAGLQGHLVTITSAAENAFVYSLAGNDWTWIGAQRIGTTGAFEWAAGPEAGTIFYGPGAASGSYANFNPGEPNNTAEDGVNMWINGLWNDLPKYGELPFVVEYSEPITAPVPLPAGAVLMLSGLGALALKGRRKAAA